MAKTLSTMLALGTKAPGFCLPTPDGKSISLHDFDHSPALLVVFICNHCPYVIHIQRSFAEFAVRYQKRGVAIVAINSNDSDTYPDDRPEKMAETIRTAGYTFPYLCDETQQIARAYQAACTPDFFLFDRDRRLVYRGQYDDSRPGNDRPITGADLVAATDALLSGLPIPQDQKPSMGCNIKWKAARAAG